MADIGGFYQAPGYAPDFGPASPREYAEQLTGLAALRALCEGLRYKPGWVFEVRGARMLYEAYRVPDRNPPYQMRTQHVTMTIPEPLPGEGEPKVGAWQAWLCQVVIFVEAHEVFEFFRPWGERVYDPHTEAGRDKARYDHVGAELHHWVGRW